MPFGSNAAFTRFISAISAGRQLEAEIRRLREPDAVLAADRPFERHDAFEEPPHRLVRRAPASLLSCSSVPASGIMMLTWMLPSPACPKRRDRQPALLLDVLDEREQLRHAAARHDDVVVELDGRDLLQRGESSRRSCQMSSRSASDARACTSIAPAPRGTRPRPAAISRPTASGEPSTSTMQHGAACRRRHRPARVRRDRLERCGVDQFDGGRHDAAPDQAASPRRPRASMSANSASSVACAGGFGISRSVISVMMASVPSEPTSSCVRS